jgi:DNA-binding MarR family transcriptional regulator
VSVVESIPIARPAPAFSTQDALNVWRDALVATVRADRPDLSARQLAILLTVYLTPPPHTVRDLSALLRLPKPAVTRALDKLEALGFARRAPDDRDKRSIVVRRTVKGSVYLSDFAEDVTRSLARLTGDESAAIRPR